MSDDYADWKAELKDGAAMLVSAIPLFALALFLDRDFGEAWSLWASQALERSNIPLETIRLLIFTGFPGLVWIAVMIAYFRLIKPRWSAP